MTRGQTVKVVKDKKDSFQKAVLKKDST